MRILPVLPRVLPVLLLASLAACGAQPAPQFFGATRHDITLQGYQFVVFKKKNRAEVIRLGYLTRAQRGPVQALMVQAAEQTTGCAVTGLAPGPALPGDTGEVRLRLSCPSD